MIKKISQLLEKDVLIKGSAIVFLGSTLTNFGAYLFHFLMGRFLGPVNYGELMSLISLTYLLNIPIAVLGLVVVKFVSQKLEDKKGIVLFLRAIFQKVLVFGGLLLLLFFLIFPWLQNLLKVSSFFLFAGIGIYSYLSAFFIVLVSVFQGTNDFFRFGLFNSLNSWLKLLTALALVLVGWKVGGAVIALILAVFLSLFFGYLSLKKRLPLEKNFNGSSGKPVAGLGSYSLVVLLANLSLASFYTIDIILARHYLTPVGSGEYAALSVFGKIIFFASSSIASVMFPLASEKQAKGENYRHLLVPSFLLVLGISTLISGLYFLFPKLMIGFLYGKEFLSISADLGLFAVFISLYSLCSLFINFYLSVSQLKIILVPIFFALLQIVLIGFSHQNIHQIITVDIITMSLLLLSLLIWYFRENSFKASLARK